MWCVVPATDQRITSDMSRRTRGVMARGHDGCSAGGYTAQSLSQHLLINRRQTHERFVRDQHFWQASKRQS